MDIVLWCWDFLVHIDTHLAQLLQQYGAWMYVILFAIVFLIFMLKILKPWLNKMAIKNNNTLSAGFMSLLFLVLITSTLITNVLGLHALFGALIAGITMPKNEALRTQLIHKIEDLTIVILLPLFFVINGLRTEIGLIDSPKLIIITAFITFVAVFGKIVGSAIPAKIVGFNWKDSFTMGVLMNTRGLMELVVLNIGFEMGIFTKELFTMFVFMALITTFMTSPLLHFVHFLFQPKKSGETGN
jgi:Kef-type K+ transport system membrane component KefB